MRLDLRDTPRHDYSLEVATLSSEGARFLVDIVLRCSGWVSLPLLLAL